MYLRKDTATTIIKEISMILDYDINIMDEKGAILASTDPSRVGMFHEGAFLIIRNQLKELAVYQDEQYQGCRKGINLPIFLKEEIIGVIGITGEVSEVMKYGKVLRKMTEILTRDLFAYHKKNQEEQARLFFANEWINKEPFEFLPSFREELHRYGLSPKTQYTVAIVTPPSVLEEADSLHHQNCLWVQTGEYGLIIHSGEDFSTSETFIRQAAKESGVTQYLCTVGGMQQDYTGVGRSFRQAQKLMHIKSEQSGIFRYEDAAIELIFNDVPLEYKELLNRQIFAGLSRREQIEFADFIEVYIRNNGSVNAIAEELFVHKNTVQYKILKILKKTGKDPRIIEDIVALMMAARWVQKE